MNEELGLKAGRSIYDSKYLTIKVFGTKFILYFENCTCNSTILHSNCYPYQTTSQTPQGIEQNGVKKMVILMNNKYWHSIYTLV